ncbi:hypothetical protein [uncultured Sunxiuqinia sp.]|uniref:hypothetical protein n=1 Tax=uncultured Sunxiuqinia sp. TaxID=1573825 RepID=UPI002612692F|nr:hypothetical protein [uncultured Sunxiuqinia sp.]
MADNFGNLDWVDGQVSVPGIYPELYFTTKNSIVAWPQLPDAPADAAAEVTLAGNFTLGLEADEVTSKVWKRVNCIDIKSQPTSEQQGEVRCKTYLNKLKVVVSLTNEEATALAKLAANTDLVWAFRERDSGKFRVCGSEKFMTVTKVTLDIGGAPTSEKGTTIEIEAVDVCPFPFYDGLITDDAGEVNPAAV